MSIVNKIAVEQELMEHKRYVVMDMFGHSEHLMTNGDPEHDYKVNIGKLLQQHNIPHPMGIKKSNFEAERILDEEAKKTMLKWGLWGFRRSYPRLFRAIINSMERYRKEK